MIKLKLLDKKALKGRLNYYKAIESNLISIWP